MEASARDALMNEVFPSGSPPAWPRGGVSWARGPCRRGAGRTEHGRPKSPLPIGEGRSWKPGRSCFVGRGVRQLERTHPGHGHVPPVTRPQIRLSLASRAKKKINKTERFICLCPRLGNERPRSPERLLIRRRSRSVLVPTLTYHTPCHCGQRPLLGAAVTATRGLAAAAGSSSRPALRWCSEETVTAGSTRDQLAHQPEEISYELTTTVPRGTHRGEGYG